MRDPMTTALCSLMWFEIFTSEVDCSMIRRELKQTSDWESSADIVDFMQLGDPYLRSFKIRVLVQSKR